MLSIGQKAPEFSLPDQNGDMHALSDYKGKWVILYFYPKDMTPGCTIEACTFRDNETALKKAGITVLGVSADSIKRHKKFEEKHELNFTLLSDEEKGMLKAYEAWGKKKMMGREYEGIYRISYLINKEGEIAKVYEKVKPAAHALEVIEDVNEYGK